MTDTNMLKYFTALAEAIRDGGDVSQAADMLEREFGDKLTYDTDDLREFIANNEYEDREILAEGIADIMAGQEGFGAEIFKNYATGVYPHPYSPRRSWIMLADAIGKYLDHNEDAARWLNQVVDLLPIDDSTRLLLIEGFGTLRSNKTDSRTNIARIFALILSGQEKFDTGRFIFHATSNDTDNKWKYNELFPEAAMKTTIEGGGETVIVL
jgi:hypothetical protein